MNKFIILFLISIFVSGCSIMPQRDINITTNTIETCINPPKAESIRMRLVEPVVIKDQFDIYWIGIAPRHYENVALNNEDILKYIKQQKAVINYYKECIARNKDDTATEK